MNTLMFFYTLAILVICIVTAVLSLAAYASSRRRFFIYGSGVFICYAIEMTEIFFFEYTLQNQSFPASDYYSITMPVLRTFVATASQAFYLAHCHGFARQAFKKAVCHSRRNVLAERAADYRRCPLRPHSSMALLHDTSGIPCFRGAIYLLDGTQEHTSRAEGTCQQPTKAPDYRRYSGRLHRCRGFLQHPCCSHEPGTLLAAAVPVRAQL